MMRRLISISFLLAGGLLLPFSGAFAQTNPDSTLDEPVLDVIIEDAITDLEADDQTDFTIFTDALEDMQRKPLDLNNATAEELLMLPGMNAIKVNNLLAYIQEFGKLTSIYELQAVEGFDAELFLGIKPYITVAGTNLDIGRKLHPAGPPIRDVLSESKHELLLRMTTILERQKGYRLYDVNPEGDSISRYEGSSQRYYARYRMRYNNNFSMALVGEKDPGERIQWNPEQQFYGFDFLAGHISIGDYGPIKRLVVGDFNIQSGQGLLLSTGLGFGKGSQAVNAVKRQNYGIRPYASVNENQFMRGAAATVAVQNFYFTGFFSRVARDANVLDTLSSLDLPGVSSLQTSGFHRTTSEIEDKNSLLESSFGGRVEYKRRWLTLGGTHYFQLYDKAFPVPTKDYQFFNFTGKNNYLSSLDFDLTVRNFNFFGELGRSRSGGTGMVLGMLTSLHPKVDLAFQFRNLDPDFHSTRAFIFAERPTAAANERGAYLGLTVTPSPKWILSAYYDQFVFPWNRFNVAFPSRGNEFFTQLEYKPSRAIQMYVRFRSDNKEINARDLPDGQQIEFLVPTNRKSLRLNFAYKIHRNFNMDARIEKSWYRRGYQGAYEEQHGGLLAYQDISWKLGWKWKVTARYAVFDVQDYDARIYAYENDILGFFNIPAYSGLGSRYYLMLNFKPVKGVEFWARFARTKMQYERTIGSGNEEIQGDTRSELKLQARFTF